jgi:hypothetical protein
MKREKDQYDNTYFYYNPVIIILDGIKGVGKWNFFDEDEFITSVTKGSIILSNDYCCSYISDLLKDKDLIINQLNIVDIANFANRYGYNIYIVDIPSITKCAQSI